MSHQLNRRDFVMSTVAGIAAAVTAEGGGDPSRTRATKLTLENEQVVWEFLHSGQSIASTGLRNKVTGRYFPLTGAQELCLTLSAAKERIEIPWWQCSFGADNDSTAPEAEAGYKQGFHQKDFDDSKWTSCFNFGLRGVSASAGLAMNQGRAPVVYQGYGWFRAKFELPASARGEDVVLNLGGYDETDWKEYWVYVNGVDAGRRSASSRWKTPGQFRLAPNSPAHQALHFGPGEANVIAVRTYSYDRHYGGLDDNILDRHIYDAVLYDQFVTVGEPYNRVAGFEVTEVSRGSQSERPSMTVKLVDAKSKLSAEVHYELEGGVRRKWAEIKNDGADRALLLDVDLDTFQLDTPLADGGYGYPLTVDDQAFAAIEHPSGFNRWNEHTLQLTHFPGRWLAPGEVWRTHSAIVGVGPAGARRQFLDYLEAHAVRKNKMLGLYDPFGVTSFTDGTSWALNDHQNAGTLNFLADWQKRGIKFDYYIPDMSLDTTQSSDLKGFRLLSFPEGPGEMVKQINDLGMKFGQWFCVTAGSWSNGRNPKMAPSYIPHPKEAAHPAFRNGYLDGMWGGVHDLCVASEPYFSTLRDAVVHHINHNHVELFKLDCGDYYCNSTQHGHLPGKYSTEASFSSLIEIARAARAANPDVFVVWYWGIYSPFLALHGDVIFDIRLSMEAASTGDYPALFFRDAVTQALDQGSQFASWVPPKNHDSLGVWLANNWWGNQMETERWQEGIIMDLGRGNGLFPQIWSDLYNLEDRDVEFLARVQAVVKKNEPVFFTRRYLIGDAWKDDIYGYSYFQGAHGFVFLNNVSFDCRTVKLALGEAMGLRAGNGQRLQMRLHHPQQAALTRNGSPDFAAGEEVTIQLRPFEVAMLEVGPDSYAPGLPARDVMESSPRCSYLVPVQEAAGGADLEIHFADAEALERRGYHNGYKIFEANLPEYAVGRHHLAVVNTFTCKGRRWRQPQMSELVQAIAAVDGNTIEFTSTPDFRQTSNNQWNPWIVFSAPLPAAFKGRKIQFGVSTYLPLDVEMTTKLWVVKEWWPPRMRSLPNYWV